MSRFDKYMLHVDVGTDEKLASLTASERLCHVVGVLAVAAKSPIRGCLIVGDEEATAAHVARRAALPNRVAASTLRKLIAVGVLIRDEDIGAWRVHNWERYNPEPKKDATNAQRQARWRSRNGASNAAVTQPLESSNDGSLRASAIARARSPEGVEVEEEGRKTPLPPKGGRRRDRELFDEECKAYAGRLGVTKPDGWQNVQGAIQHGARDDEAVFAWVEHWRPDLLPESVAA